jgi:hypothetical protein
MTRGWRKLHTEDLHYLYFSPNSGLIKSQRIGWVRHVAFMYKFSVGEFNWKRLLGRHGCKWEDNIRTNIRKI